MTLRTFTHESEEGGTEREEKAGVTARLYYKEDEERVYDVSYPLPAGVTDC